MRSVSQNVIKYKVGLLNLTAELGDVSRACKVMGFSCDRFYRYQTALEAGGVGALIDANRRKPNLRNRVEEATEVAVSRPSSIHTQSGQQPYSTRRRRRLPQSIY